MINDFAVNPKVGIRKVVLISTSFGVSFRELNYGIIRHHGR